MIDWLIFIIGLVIVVIMFTFDFDNNLKQYHPSLGKPPMIQWMAIPNGAEVMVKMPVKDLG